MDDSEFYDNMKSDEEKFSEQVAGAEHLVRLKLQAGQTTTTDRDADLELAKEADFEDEHGCYDTKSSIAPRLRKALEKRAGLGDLIGKSGVNPVMAGLMGIGAVGNGAATYLASRPKERLGGKSSAEADLENAVQAQNLRPEDGFLDKMNRRRTEFQHGISKAFREHPVKGSLISAGTGAAGGAAIGKLLGLGLRMKSGGK